MEAAESPTSEPVMPSYIGCNIIKARPMNLGDYNKYRDWTILPDENPSREGYLVVYLDGYEIWLPKEVFEGGYRRILDGGIVDSRF